MRLLYILREYRRATDDHQGVYCVGSEHHQLNIGLDCTCGGVCRSMAGTSECQIGRKGKRAPSRFADIWRMAVYELPPAPVANLV
jgi:hypothetical protein